MSTLRHHMIRLTRIYLALEPVVTKGPTDLAQRASVERHLRQVYAWLERLETSLPEEKPILQFYSRMFRLLLERWKAHPGPVQRVEPRLTETIAPARVPATHSSQRRVHAMQTRWGAFREWLAHPVIETEISIPWTAGEDRSDPAAIRV